MPWINPLDRVPQIPQDWANHIAYGGALGLVTLAGLNVEGVDDAAAYAALAVLSIAATKKLVDYIKEGESAAVCIGKALVTAAWPTSIWLAGVL